MLDGHCSVRKVQRDTRVWIDTVAYYATQAVIGKVVTMRIEAATRSYVIVHEGQELKRVPMRGTGRGLCSFTEFVDRLCQEARVGRLTNGTVVQQLSIPI